MDEKNNSAQSAPTRADKTLKRARVRSVVGDMRHLYTDVLVTSDDKLMDLDQFALTQIETGKWEIVAD